jgi:uncharacterized protein
MSSPAATLVESRVIRAGREADFARWADAQAAALAAAPGHQGTVRLEQADGLFHLIARFHDEAALRGFRDSPEAQALAAQADALSVALVQQGTGDDLRLTIPSEAAARKWKRFVTTLAAVFPVLLVLSTAVRSLVPHWPPPAQLLLSSPLLTATLQWLILPRLQRWSRLWTLRDAHGRLAREPG